MQKLREGKRRAQDSFSPAHLLGLVVVSLVRLAPLICSHLMLYLHPLALVSLDAPVWSVKTATPFVRLLSAFLCNHPSSLLRPPRRFSVLELAIIKHGGSRRRPAIIKHGGSRRGELLWGILRVPGRAVAGELNPFTVLGISPVVSWTPFLRFRPCDSVNCLSTFGIRERKKIAPIPHSRWKYNGEATNEG